MSQEPNFGHGKVVATTERHLSIVRDGVEVAVGERAPLAIGAQPSQDRLVASVGWVERVTSYVRVAAAANPAVERAFVSNDGTQVLLTSATSTPELRRAGAALVVALRREFNPEPPLWIEGGFTPAMTVAPADCRLVYER